MTGGAMQELKLFSVEIKTDDGARRWLNIASDALITVVTQYPDAKSIDARGAVLVPGSSQTACTDFDEWAEIKKARDAAAAAEADATKGRELVRAYNKAIWNEREAGDTSPREWVCEDQRLSMMAWAVVGAKGADDEAV